MIDVLPTADPRVRYRRHPDCLPGPKISAVATAGDIVIVEGWEQLVLAGVKGENPEISMIVGMKGRDGASREYTPDEAIRLLRAPPDSVDASIERGPQADPQVQRWAKEVTPGAIIADGLSPRQLATLADMARQVGSPLQAVREMRYVAERWPELRRDPGTEWAAYALLAHRDDRFEVMERLRASVAPGAVTGDLVREWLAANTHVAVDGQRRTGSVKWWQEASDE